MDAQTAEKLLTLNREFYAAFAQQFASSRPFADPAITSILPYIPKRARGISLLDIGCGNGRLALLLEQERPGATYVGLDSAPELIEIARAQTAPLRTITARFHVVDVARPGWSQALGSRSFSFDSIACLAVLHHIPSLARRADILREARDLLMPDGRIILSTWQFLSHARLRRKIVNWDEVNIAPEKLEAGDYLLDWKRGGRGVRYCHLVDEAEIADLAAESGLRVRETFRAGGREGDLSLFAVLEHKTCPPKTSKV